MGRRGQLYTVYDLTPVFDVWIGGALGTYADLARRAGVDPSSVYRLVHNRNRQPTRETAENLARVVGLSVQDLIVGPRLRDEEKTESAKKGPAHAHV